MRSAIHGKVFLAAIFFGALSPVHAQEDQELFYINDENIPNIIEELNPFDPNIEKTLQELDRVYEEETGKSAHLPDYGNIDELLGLASCYRADCPIWIRVSRTSQTFSLYVYGNIQRTGLISSGLPGYGTPAFDKHPDGRIYDRYTSTKYPGGDYMGLGNMPYAVFISGGFALHGTPEGNWSKLGKRASHGCIRMHPDNAFVFNRLVRQHGVRNVWITIE